MDREELRTVIKQGERGWYLTSLADEGTPAAWLRIAKSLRHTGKGEEALLALEFVPTDHKHYGNALTCRGASLTDLGLHDDALLTLVDACQISSSAGLDAPLCALSRTLREKSQEVKGNDLLVDSGQLANITYDVYPHEVSLNTLRAAESWARNEGVESSINANAQDAPEVFDRIFSTHGREASRPYTLYAVTDEKVVKVGLTRNLDRRREEHRKQGLGRLVREREGSMGFIRGLETCWLAYVRSQERLRVNSDRLPDGYSEALFLTEEVKQQVLGLFD